MVAVAALILTSRLGAGFSCCPVIMAELWMLLAACGSGGASFSGGVGGLYLGQFMGALSCQA